MWLGFTAVSLMVTALGASALDTQWLRDDGRSDNRVLEHLKRENTKSDAYLKQVEKLSTALTREWEERAPNKAEKPWLLQGGNSLRIQQVGGKRALVLRDGDGRERVLVDLDQRQGQHDYYRLGRWSLSPDGSRMALAEDILGDGSYRISVLDLEKRGELELASGMDHYLLWSTRGDALFAVAFEEGTQRPYQLRKLSLNRGGEPQVLWEERDPHFLLSAYAASDGRHAVIQSNSETATEQRLLDLAEHQLSKPLLPRADGLEYYADSNGQQLYINSNQQGPFRMFARSMQGGPWRQLYDPGDSQIENYFLFRSALVVVERSGHDSNLVVLGHQGNKRRTFPLGGESSVAWVSRNGDYNSDRLRVRSMSMVSPPTWTELDLASLRWTVLSADDYPDYQQQQYRTERLWVNQGGVQVPVTLAYRQDRLTKSSPVVLYGYGAYGVTMRPYFMSQLISLMDRGAIYAVAHVRGGGYFGEQWHQQGKGVLKGNGIEDYLAAAETMKAFRGGQHPVLAIGGSAGGTLVAAALNRKPQLFRAAVLQVPFVDVVASMFDTSLPLTMQQYGEWGNPNDPQQLAAMRAYDPVVNVGRQAYPPIMVQVGLHDQRVPYWEGAKYHLKLSELSTGTGPYLLRTDFEAGHDADKRNAILRQAQEYAFLLSQVQPSDLEQ